LVVNIFLLVIQFLCASLACVYSECLNGILGLKMVSNLVFCNLYLYYVYRNTGCMYGSSSSSDKMHHSESRDELAPDCAEKIHALYSKHVILSHIIQKRANVKVNLILKL
jgi:hypothetical protein